VEGNGEHEKRRKKYEATAGWRPIGEEEEEFSRDGMRKLREGGSDDSLECHQKAGPRQAYRERDDTLGGCCAVETREDIRRHEGALSRTAEPHACI